MKKIVLSSILVMAISFTGCGLGDASIPSSSSSKSTLTEQDIDQVLVVSKKATELLKKSTLNLTGVLSGSEAKAKLEASLADANKIDDPKERDAKVNALVSDAAAQAIKDGETEEGKAKLEALSSDQKKETGKAIVNLTMAGLLDAYAVKLGTDVADKASADPMGAGVTYASKLVEVKDVVAALPDQVVEISKMSESLVAIAQTGGIAVELPTQSDVTEAVSSSR